MDTSEEQIASCLHQYITINKTPVEKVIVDIGANDGVELSNSYYFIKDLGWEAVLVEPQEWLKNVIEYNLQTANYEVLSVAVSDVAGRATLTSGPNDNNKSRSSEIHNMGASLVDRGGNEKWEVDVWTFQKLLDETKLKNIDILSVDTEGNDGNIIKSMLETNVRPRFIITEDWSREKEIEEYKKQLLKDGGYELIIFKSSNKVYEYKHNKQRI